MSDLLDQQLHALGYFKDWSNALLVATTAALGWATTQVSFRGFWWRFATLSALALSIVFGMLTLSLIPLIAGQMRVDCPDNTSESVGQGAPCVPRGHGGPWSFYDVRPQFHTFGSSSQLWSTNVKFVCWPQHLLFLVGVLTYAAGGSPKQSKPRKLVLAMPKRFRRRRRVPAKPPQQKEPDGQRDQQESVVHDANSANHETPSDPGKDTPDGD